MDKRVLLSALVMLANTLAAHEGGLFWDGYHYDAKRDRWCTSIVMLHDNQAALGNLLYQVSGYLRG